MTIDEQVREYTLGFIRGVEGRPASRSYLDVHPDFGRGYAAGRAAYLAAEQAERVLLERCECSYLHRVGTSQRTNHAYPVDTQRGLKS